MKLVRFLKSKTFWVNNIVAIIVLVLLFLGLNYWLNSYTRHNENVTVPNLAKLAYTEAMEELKKLELAYSILDSAEFNPAYPRGSVMDQYPTAGSLVKEGREIKLTLNPLKPRKIALPELIEKTKRRAIYDLESKGFKVGELTYVPYIGKDVVVDVKVEGYSVKFKDKFDKGTVVDLILGQGLGNTRIKVPYLKWKNLEKAEDKLLSSSLNLGSILYDEDVTDTLAALVYKQYPAPTLGPAINLGQQVDIWLTNDHTKITNDSLQFLTYDIPDSLQVPIDSNDVP